MLVSDIFRKSLKTKLLGALLVITLVPLVILNLISYLTLKDQLEEDQSRRLSGYSRRIARTVDMALNERAGDISAWSSLETVHTALDIGGGQAGANQLFENLNKGYGTFDLLTLLDRSGICIAANLPQAISMDNSDQSWFKEAIGGKYYIGDFGNYPMLKQLVPSSKGWSLLIASPVFIQNEVRGVLAGYVRWEVVNKIIDAFPVQTTGYTYMVNRSDMLIIAHPTREIIGLKLTDPKINVPIVADAIAANDRGYAVYPFLNPATGRQVIRAVGFMRNEGFGAFSRDWVVASGADYDEIFAALPRQRNRNLVISAVFVGLLVGGALLLSRGISRPIVDTSHTMVAITRDLDFTKSIEVRGKDEISEMESAFNGLVRKLRETFGTIVEGNLQVSTAVNRVKVISGKIVTNASEQAKRAQDVLKRIETMGQTAAEVQRNALESQQSYDSTAVSITQLTASVQEIARAAQSQTTMVEEARDIINLMGETAQQVAARAQQQHNAAEDTARAAESMASSISEVSAKASQAGKQSETSYQAATEGRKAVEDVVRGMHSIAESSEQITEIIEVISDIADQTNLLALNAAIEAARAGEHGRGFAVVAEEVRKLAERTAESAKEISTLIKNSADRVKEGTGIATASQKALDNIVSAVDQTNALIRDIDQATNEQARGIKRVAEAMDHLRKLSQEITAMTTEQGKRRERSADIMNSVYHLSQEVSASTQEQARSADQIMREVSLATKRSENITDMTNQQKERSQTLQRIMEEMSNVALTNASGARNSQESSEKLADIMNEFTGLIGQFKIGKTAGNGNGQAHNPAPVDPAPPSSGRQTPARA
jgi:methyl-accepting chemotaxis protein